MAYAERNMIREMGIQFVKEKLERSYRKLSTESKNIYKNKYHQVLDILT